MTSSRVRGKFRVTCRSAVSLKNFRHIGVAGRGIHFDYAWHSSVERVLSEGFAIPISFKAGNCWDVTYCYLLGTAWGMEIRNDENADEGDGTVFGTTFADPSGRGVAAVHYISSGGLRFLNNKSLGYDYGILAETEGVTSDLLSVCNSIENYRKVGIAGRTQTGSFENVVISANQFASMAPAVTMNGLDRGACVGNVANCPGRVLNRVNASRWTDVGNQGNY